MKYMSRPTDRDDREREADHFAMCLLVPEDALRERWPVPTQGSWLQHGERIVALAKEFQVDELLMVKRLTQLELIV